MRHMRRTARAEAHTTIQQQTTVVFPKQSTGINRKVPSIRLIPRIPKFCTSDDGVDAGTVGTCWRANVHEEYGKHATPHPLKVTQATRLQWGGIHQRTCWTETLQVIHILNRKAFLWTQNFAPSWTPDAAMNEPRSATRWPGRWNRFVSKGGRKKRINPFFPYESQHIL